MFLQVYNRKYGEGKDWTYDQAREEAALRPVLDACGIDGGLALDLGCGTGFHTDLLRHMGFTAAGMDLSDEGISLATEKYPDCRFICADAGRMEAYFPRNSLDLLFVRGMSWFHYELTEQSQAGVDVPKVTAYLMDFVKPGGCFLLQIATDFSGKMRGDVRMNTLDEYLTLGNNAGGYVMGVWDWAGRLLIDEVPLKDAAGGIIMVVRC